MSVITPLWERIKKLANGVIVFSSSTNNKTSTKTDTSASTTTTNNTQTNNTKPVENKPVKISDTYPRFAHNLYKNSAEFRTEFMTKAQHVKVMNLANAAKDGYYLSLTSNNYMWLPHDKSNIVEHFVECDADTDGYVTCEDLCNIDDYCLVDTISITADGDHKKVTLHIGYNEVATFSMTKAEADKYNKKCNNVAQTAYKR